MLSHYFLFSTEPVSLEGEMLSHYFLFSTEPVSLERTVVTLFSPIDRACVIRADLFTFTLWA